MPNPASQDPTRPSRLELNAPSPLEMPPGAMRETGQRALEMLVQRLSHLRERRPWGAATRAELHARLHEPPPAGPADFGHLLEVLATDVLPHAGSVDHPRFMAFVGSAPTWPGILGELLACGYNVFQGTWLESAGPSTIELTVLDWFRTWVGYPAGAEGILLSGGSAANLTAMVVARQARFGAHDPRAVIYHCTETHSSAVRAARILGFADEQLRALPVDDDFRMRPVELDAAMAADAAAGRVPFLVVANGGATSTGAVDPLPALAEVCRTREAWLHVDAAYGGFALLTERGRVALRGIEAADSVTLDPHKWLYQPFEAGCLLVREGRRLADAFHIMPDYLQDTAVAAGELPEVNFADRGLQLSRGFRALKIWLSVKSFGAEAFRLAIDRTLDLAAHAEARIRARPELFELLSPAALGVVCFQRCFPAREEALNAALVRGLAESGTGMISSTRVRGRYALRLCILSHRTTAADVDAVLDWLGSADPAGS